MTKENIDEKINISKAREMKVTKNNALVQKTRYSLTVAEQKTLCYIISLLKPQKESEPLQLVYEFNIVDYCKIVGISYNGRSLSDIKKTLKGLSDKSFWIIEWNEGQPVEKLLRWINEVTIKQNSGKVIIEISKNMIPYLYNLYNNFVSYHLYWILALSSTYSIRFYELLSSYLFVGNKEFTIDEIRNIMNCQNKYKGYKDLKKWVIEPSILQINEYTNLTVQYKTIKTGRTITSIIFEIKEKKNIDSLISYKKTIAKVNGMEFNDNQYNIFEYLIQYR